MQSRSDRRRKLAIPARQPAARADQILAEFTFAGKCDALGYNPIRCFPRLAGFCATLHMPPSRPAAEKASGERRVQSGHLK
jgi:hypothetical protein